MNRLMPATPRILIVAACALLAALAVAAAVRHGGVAGMLSRAYSDEDFAAFYCAGKIAVSGADPYRVEPLRTCEHSLDSWSARANAFDITPAPLPGYSLALFGLVARLPYSVALRLWYVVLLAAFGAAAWCLVRVTKLPWYVVIAALAVPFAYSNFVFVQLPPVAVAALCIAAYCARDRRFVAAGIAGACSMIEPHIGLPACVAMLLFLPAARLALVASGAVLALASIAALGIHGNVEYFARVLPLHALAEAGSSDQLSFTWFLHWFGAGDRVAVLAGSISYVVMLVIGCILARWMARSCASDHFIVLLPPAVAMLGGAFVHSLQYAAVMPGALAVAAALDTAAAWAAVALLAVPWQFEWHSRLLATVASLALGSITWHAVRHASLLRRTALAVGAVLAFMLLTLGIANLPDTPVQAASSPTAFFDSLGADQQLASAPWGVKMRTDPAYAQASAETFAQKLFPWTGLVVMIASVIAALAAGRRATGVAPSSDRPARLPASAGVLIALVAANVCITLTLSALLNIDTDESYTMHTTSGSAHFAVNRAINFELQPPLYFGAMWAWRLMNSSVFFGRLFSVFCIAITLVIVWAISKRIAPATNPAWITAAVAFNPFTIWCAVDMRVYALVMLLSSLLLLTFFGGFIARLSLPAQIGFAATALVGLLTFYYIGFLLVGFGAALLELRRWRALGMYAMLSAGLALALAPLALVIGHQAAALAAATSTHFWFGDNLGLLAKALALAAMPIRWAKWHGLWLVLLVVLGAFGIHVIRSMAKSWPPRRTPELAATACVVAFAAFSFVAAVTFTQQALANRYIVFLFVPFVACGYAAFAAFNDYVRRTLAAAALGAALVAGSITLLFQYGALAKSGDWQRVASYIMREEQPNEPILVFQAEAAGPLTYYYRGANHLVPVPRALNAQTYDLSQLVLTSEREVEQALARAPGPHRDIWVVTTTYCSTGSLDYNCPLFESYLARHYVVLRRLSFYESTLRKLERVEGDDRSASTHGAAEMLHSSARPRVRAEGPN